MNYTIQTTLTLDAEMFEDVIDTALESGIGYWANSGRHDRLSEALFLTWDGSDFADDSYYKSGGMVVLYSDIVDAIEALLTRTYQVRNDLHTQLNEWLCGSPTMDSELADVIIQIALFGKLIYG